MINELKLDPNLAALQVQYEYLDAYKGQWAPEPTHDFVCGLKDHSYEEGWNKAIDKAHAINARADRRHVRIVLTIAGVSTVVRSWQEVRDFLATTWVPKLVKAEPKAEPTDSVGVVIRELQDRPHTLRNGDILGVLWDLNNKINTILATHQTGSATPKGDN